MGLFTGTQKKAAENLYDKTVKKFLKPKDGLKHVVMINSFSKMTNQVFGCEDKYTTQVDTILIAMQEDGYEIIDIKLTTLQNQGIFKDAEGFNTLIIYK